jgi:hypothetical protein
MAQQDTAKAKVIVWEPGEYGVVQAWHGYLVGSRDDAYAELLRIEGTQAPSERQPRSSGDGRQ